MVEKSRQFVSVFACLWLMTVLFGSIAFCAFSNDARAWGTEYNVSATPSEFTQNVPIQITVSVTNSNGQPVNGAKVIMYYADPSSSNPGLWMENNAPLPSPTSTSFPGGSGVTGADGTWTTTFTPDIGSDSIRLFIQASNGTESGYSDYEVMDDPTSGDDSMINKIMNAIGRGIAVGIVMFIILIITAAGWYSSTVAVKKRFEGAKLAGFNKKVEDKNSSADPLKHPDGADIFKNFKEGLRETKESKLFITKSLLKSFVVKKINLHYGGIVRGDEEVEYFSTEVKEQRVNDSFKLHADPKPTPPSKFTAEDDVQTFPISEKIADCGTCKATGQIVCDKCKGDAKKECPVCHWSGHMTCSRCNGFKYIKYTGGSEIGSPMKAVGTSSSLEGIQCTLCNGSGKSTCEMCKGRGYFPCEKCAGTGKITCTFCKGDKQTRHLTCKVWRYKHEKLRQLHGPEDQNINPDRFDELGNTMQRGPSLDDSSAAPTYPSENTETTPYIRAIVESARNSYKTWKGRAKGRVVLDKHELMLSPITDLDIGYPSKEGNKTFKIWALGNPKAYVLDAGETPTQLTARYAARHAAYAVVMLVEIAFFAYAIVYWHILG